MPLIMLGTGAARVVVNVDEVPDPEDEITVRSGSLGTVQRSTYNTR